MRIFKNNCIYFQSDRPCNYHKKFKVSCGSCGYFRVSSEGMPGKQKKILIIKLGALGDVLRTTSILKSLYEKYRKPLISWVTYKNAVPLIANIKYIKEVIPYDSSIFTRLFFEKYDMLVNLELSADALLLTPIVRSLEKKGFWIDIERRCIGYNREAEELFVLSHDDILKKKNKKTYQEIIFEAVGLKLPGKKDYKILVELDEKERKFADEFAEKHGLKNKKIVGINTGGGSEWKKKEWPIDNTVGLIRLILGSSKYARNTKFIIFGGEKEKSRNSEIMKHFRGNSAVIDSGTGNTIRQFISLVNLCDVLVTTDTLAMHIATGLGKRIVSLFGPTSANEIETYGLGRKVVSPMECAVCYRRDCELSPACMDSISPVYLYNILTKMI